MRAEYILGKFSYLPLNEKVDILFKALDHMKEANYRSKAACIGLAMGIPEDPQVQSITNIQDYTITVVFDNGEERAVDLVKVLDGGKRFDKALLEDYEQFQSVEVLEGTLAWPNLGIWTKDIKGKKVFRYYDIDPGLLYENSAPAGVEEAGGS
ncbi:MAG: DUF2442 domain-containing protein [Phaeodactylibacter sp.]|nr:DUF2442 domain-containing protein [Phaeodactylibacter sp.]